MAHWYRASIADIPVARPAIPIINTRPLLPAHIENRYLNFPPSSVCQKTHLNISDLKYNYVHKSHRLSIPAQYRTPISEGCRWKSTAQYPFRVISRMVIGQSCETIQDEEIFQHTYNKHELKDETGCKEKKHTLKVSKSRHMSPL